MGKDNVLILSCCHKPSCITLGLYWSSAASDIFCRLAVGLSPGSKCRQQLASKAVSGLGSCLQSLIAREAIRSNKYSWNHLGTPSPHQNGALSTPCTLCTSASSTPSRSNAAMKMALNVEVGFGVAELCGLPSGERRPRGHEAGARAPMGRPSQLGTGLPSTGGALDAGWPSAGGAVRQPRIDGGELLLRLLGSRGVRPPTDCTAQRKCE